MSITLSLWEENVKDSFYEICHFVVIPVHQMLYGCAPPHISESIIGNLKAIVDWFIEESFSYVRVFRCSIPPHALLKFLPDRLVCREVAYQIQIVGNHLAHCNMKSYEHEKSPCDDMFKGARTYEEVLDRGQTLSPDLQTSFLIFQRHRRSGFPKVL
jgi:hypothetical protein